jgi:hypothetical protein
MSFDDDPNADDPLAGCPDWKVQLLPAGLAGTPRALVAAVRRAARLAADMGRAAGRADAEIRRRALEQFRLEFAAEGEGLYQDETLVAVFQRALREILAQPPPATPGAARRPPDGSRGRVVPRPAGAHLARPAQLRSSPRGTAADVPLLRPMGTGHRIRSASGGPAVR